jgi:fermentation-respiration switch protein FrsA (DUF1100 family)
MKELKLFLKILLFTVFFSYILFGALLYFKQKSFVYYPDNQDFYACPGFLESEKINYEGTRAYYKKNSDKLAVFYHGNAGSACSRSFLKDEFVKAGWSYLFVEYAGYSNDPQAPSKALLLRDTENMDRFISDKGFTKLMIAGESLGTSLATYHSTLAATEKLLLISPLSSTENLAKDNYPIYPVSFMLRENFDTSAWIKNTRASDILLVHGSEDEIVPVAHSLELMHLLETEKKSFYEIAGAKHNDIYRFVETQKKISAYLQN